MKQKITLLLFLILQINLVSAQNFIEKQLPAPANLSPLFIGPLVNSTIHYGAKPPNYNGKVIIFNHGYLDLNQIFFFMENTFYRDAYNAGYQVAFVATTRGEGMWYNGWLLSKSIDIVTQRFAVNDLYIIAHSNGGKATEVAMFTYNKRNKVKRAFTLGTPFWGTYLADISQMWWFNWIWRLTPFNEGAATSTTYYCANVVRPHFDNHYLNQPNKFVTLGASGYYNGHTYLAPIMYLSGNVLNLYQGTNDGITPYYSSIRPRSSVVFYQNDYRAIMDHVDIGLGQYMWRYIKPYLNSYNRTTAKLAPQKTENKIYEVISNYQIINSENEYDIINLKKSNSTIEIIHENENATFNIKSDFKIASKKTNKSDKHKTTLVINSNSKGDISLKSNSKFIGFVRQNEDIEMKYSIQKQNNNQDLKVSFNNDTYDNSIDVNAIITKTAELNGKQVSEANSERYTFIYSIADNAYILNSNQFEAGVYSVYLTGANKDFTRNLASGFTIGNVNSIKENIETAFIEKNTEAFVKLKGSLISSEIKLEFLNGSKEKATIKIFNLNGKEVLNFKSKGQKYLTISEGVSSLKNGIYLLNITTTKGLKTFKFVKK